MKRGFAIYQALLLAFISATILPGCTTLHDVVPSIPCETSLVPKMEMGNLSVNGLAMTHPELKRLLNLSKSGAKTYHEYEYNSTVSIMSVTAALTVLAAGMMFAPATGTNSDAVMIGSFALGFAGVLFSGWQKTEARNNFLKSVYQYNYACECRKYKNGNGFEINEFYYPQQDFFSGLIFKGLCTGEILAPRSEEAKKKFVNTPGYEKVINENMLSGLIMATLYLADLGVYIYGITNDDITIANLAAIASWPLALVLSTLYDSTYNNIFYLLDIVNTGCCRVRQAVNSPGLP